MRVNVGTWKVSLETVSSPSAALDTGQTFHQATNKPTSIIEHQIYFQLSLITQNLRGKRNSCTMSYAKMHNIIIYPQKEVKSLTKILCKKEPSSRQKQLAVKSNEI